MTAIHRRSHRAPIAIGAILADADDLNGVQDETYSWDVTGAERCLIFTMIGTPGTAGVDVFCVSHDGGASWAADATLLPVTANDATGTIAVAGVLEAAGVEPITNAAAVFKAGPWEGPTAVRIFRVLTATDPKSPAVSIPWSTGAPSVSLVVIGKTSGALTALA